MQRKNIEIKAKSNNTALSKITAIAIQTDTLYQTDTYYNSKNGRFKLREELGKQSYLVQYNRPDNLDSKLSKYYIVNVENERQTDTILRLTNGMIGIVKKQRLLFIYTDKVTNIETRIHFDNVEGLGNFIEIEVMLTNETNTVKQGNDIIAFLKAELCIKPDDLISHSYYDLLQKKK